MTIGLDLQQQEIDERKARWVKALRSGKYKQGIGRLKSGNQYGTRYCCLGVLREIDSQVRASRSGTELHLATVWFNRLDQEKLIGMNDDAGANFDEIADWIEDNL